MLGLCENNEELYQRVNLKQQKGKKKCFDVESE